MARKRKAQEMTTAADEAAAVLISLRKQVVAAVVDEEEGGSAGDADRISDLSDGILGSILSRLPLRDMVRTSVLSRRWRHLWTFTPLDIGGYLISGVTKRAEDIPCLEIDECAACLIFRAMDTIVSRHRGPIHSFSLAWSTFSPACANHEHGFDGYRFLEMWAELLAQRGVRNVTMMMKLPPCLLTCPSLRTLKLIDFDDFDHQVPSLPPNLRELSLGIVIGVPPLGALSRGILACRSLCSLELTHYNLQGPFGTQMPPNLRELRLHGACVPDILLERVLSNCKFLETLDLYRCFGLEKFRINSSSLRKLRLRRINLQYRFPLYLLVEDVPNLELLMFDELFMKASTLTIVRAPHLQFLGCVNAYSKMLQLEKTCFQDGFLKDFNTQLYNLKTLSVHVNLDDVRQTKLVADLLRCFPCLECLDVEVSMHSTSPVDEDYWKLQSSLNCLDHHLKVVKLKGLSGQPNHLHFLGYLIRNARMLSSIYFLYRHESEIKWLETRKDELSLKGRASLDVAVIFQKMYCEDLHPADAWLY